MEVLFPSHSYLNAPLSLGKSDVTGDFSLSFSFVFPLLLMALISSPHPRWGFHPFCTETASFLSITYGFW